MVKESLFAGLPPPSHSAPQDEEREQQLDRELEQIHEAGLKSNPKAPLASAVKPALQSSIGGIKRSPDGPDDAGDRQGKSAGW